MKKQLLIILFVLPLLGSSQKKPIGPKTFDLIVGTYTSGDSKGIYVYRFYEETGKLAYLSEIDDIKNPTYLCVSSNNKFVYSANENEKDGSVSAFKFDKASGRLELINSQLAGGGPAYVAIDKDQKNVFAANYGNGTVTVLPVNKDGSLNPIIQTIQDEGHGKNASRQAGPHAHMAILSPDDKYLFINDLGTDKTYSYRYHASKNPPLTPADPAFTSVTPGNGPRHLDFSPNGKYVYLVQEMAAVITANKLDGGTLKPFQTINIAADSFKGELGAADIHVSPDGLFLYATNRGDANEIVAYSINQENGQLTLLARYPTMGKTPRNFVIDPTGNYLLVANQNSDNIFVYKIDKATGKLLATKTNLKIGNPVCLKMIAVE